MKQAPETRSEYAPIMRILLRTYKASFSVVFQACGIHCRHYPTCSEYCAQACSRYGIWAGSWMGLARFCRCSPGGTRGEDQMPLQLRRGASWLRPWLYGQWGAKRFDEGG
ncbi:membrane protein insertion efficiency factor YidD [Hirschia baltica]|uniref:Membrane protein insertion efficiency factor n=1 Tax=Hirschia baltica (strain ATCC 49814 / DSM 5838 / IFAM 1418) TaxID=582402 RepID=C6XNA4_HIRBI|nr:membrane protein insertion efficiency factor YidD [Hirschia baltica]ACT60048.1 protein of unknown function DUF37 [Hirschia baltica ATCC 49814]